ncbi:MAG: glycosyltransferase family 4 protein [Vulcanimicrobiaceae bacterium]
MSAAPSPLRNVVLVLDNANVDGGSAKVALSSAGALADRGYDVTVFSAIAASARTRETLPRRVRFVATEQLEILKDPATARAAVRGIWNAAAYARLRETLRPLDRAATVVHVHGWTKALSSSVVRATLDARATLAVGLHEYFTICPIGSLFDHPTGKICLRKPMGLACVTANCDSRSYAHKAYRVLRQVVSARRGGVPTDVRHFVAVSTFSRNILAPYLPSDARIYDVDNPIDAPLDERVDVARNEAFVYVGRLSAEKGPLLFARAAKRANVRAIFAGDGELAGDVRAILPDAEVTGWLDRPALANVLRRARAIVVPSLWYETFGLVVLEAASAGIPAIVPDESAARALVVEGVTGTSFRTGDVRALEAALRQYVDDAHASRLGAAAYDRYRDAPYTLEKHTTSLASAYAAMLAADAEDAAGAARTARA